MGQSLWIYHVTEHYKFGSRWKGKMRFDLEERKEIRIFWQFYMLIFLLKNKIITYSKVSDSSFDKSHVPQQLILKDI